MRVVIESLAFGGAGVAHAPDGRAVFVPLTCPGDTVDVEIEVEHSRWLEGRLADIVSPAPDRVEPKCPYFGICGGCQWQHVAYDAQAEAKRDAVVQSLRRIGGIPSSDLVGPCVKSDQEYGYRNKVELRPADDRKGALGFSGIDGRTTVAIDSCMLLPKGHTDAPRRIAGALGYAARGTDTRIERVGLRVAQRRADLEIALWTPPGPFPRGLIAKTLTASTKATSVVRVLTSGPSKARGYSKVEVLSGRGFWRERMSGATFALSAPSFFQVNTAAAETLVRTAIDALDLSEEHRVLDCYAGAGTFTLPIAGSAGEVVAIESAGSSVRDLRRNLENADLWAEVVGGDATREIPSMGTFDRVLVDPPRSGMAEGALDALCATGAARIVYVSCDPNTLARDAARFAARGYHLATVSPIDLFPQTFHIETVATFEKG